MWISKGSMLKSIPRIQDTIYMQIVFDHLLSRMGNRSKNAILQTEINTNFRKRVIKFSKLDSHSSQRYARIVHNSNIEKLIHASFSALFSDPKTHPSSPIDRKELGENTLRAISNPFTITTLSPTPVNGTVRKDPHSRTFTRIEGQAKQGWPTCSKRYL